MINKRLHAASMLWVSAAAAAEQTAPIVTKTLAKSEPVTSSNALTVLLGLLFVVAIIFALAWLLKQYSSSSFVGNKAMKIVASLPLGTRERAVLIEVADKQILIGVAPGSVNALHVFDEKVIDAPAQSSEFSNKLKQVLQASAVKNNKHENAD